MAEIKSTLELVQEKLARLERDEDTPESLINEDLVKEGMRLGASYLRGDTTDLVSAVAGRPERERRHLLDGLTQSLLRNIVLPREKEQKQTAVLAMRGLLDTGGKQELGHAFKEMEKILDQYLTQRQEYHKQLTEAFRQQMAQLEQSLAQQTGMAMKMDPSQHPKFQEQWQHILADLNGQYGKAIDKCKEFIRKTMQTK